MNEKFRQTLQENLPEEILSLYSNLVFMHCEFASMLSPTLARQKEQASQKIMLTSLAFQQQQATPLREYSAGETFDIPQLHPGTVFREECEGDCADTFWWYISSRSNNTLTTFQILGDNPYHQLQFDPTSISMERFHIPRTPVLTVGNTGIVLDTYLHSLLLTDQEIRDCPQTRRTNLIQIFEFGKPNVDKVTPAKHQTRLIFQPT